MLNQRTYSDNQLVKYLLGMSSGAEREQFDELGFVDDEFTEHLQVVEDDLMDSYHRGELSGEELARFRERYLNSPEGSGNAAFSRTFLKLIEAKATHEAVFPAAPPSEPSRWQRMLAHLFSAPEYLLPGGLAATAALLLVAGGWLLVQNARLRKEAGQAETARKEARERETEMQARLGQEQSSRSEMVNKLERSREKISQLEQQLAERRASTARKEARERETEMQARLRQEQSSRSEMVDKLERSREKISQLEQQLAERRASSSSEPTIASFDLEPGKMGLPEQAGAVSLTSGVSHIVLHLELWPNPFQTFRAELQNPANNAVVWHSGKLKARRRGDSRIVDVLLPAGLLKSQRYNLKLFGVPTDLRQDVSPNQQAEPVSNYSFRIVRP